MNRRGAAVDEWTTYTPAGELLTVQRRDRVWIVTCGSNQARNALLDVALTEAIRSSRDFPANSIVRDYGAWIRNLADQIARELGTE